MKRSPLRRRTPLRTPYRLQTRPELPAVETVERMVPTGERFVYPVRRAVSPASTLQRAKAKTGCRVTGAPADPAHVVDRSLGGCDDPLCVVPLARPVHRAYDEGAFDLLPYLTREEQAHAVSHLGLLRALRRVTGQRWTPEVMPNE